MGVTTGYGEGKPFVAATLSHRRRPRLCLARPSRAGLLFIWHYRSRSALAGPALAGTAITYPFASFAPWSVAFATSETRGTLARRGEAATGPTPRLAGARSRANARGGHPVPAPVVRSGCYQRCVVYFASYAPLPWCVWP
jgi:hypothetical protein